MARRSSAREGGGGCRLTFASPSTTTSQIAVGRGEACEQP